MSNIDISIIIPMYNVEEYLEACLDSVANQSKSHLEVIMIDDGSTDQTGEIAKRYAKQYEWFHYYYIENQGLGHARNYGVSKATGKYIAFLDSDDVITGRVYEKMFQLAEKNGSDLTVCNVKRMTVKQKKKSWIHIIAFDQIPEKTHIIRNHSLLYDSTAWNKLILKSFYDENHFQFPEGILYEDIPVTIPMYYKANHVSVLKKTVIIGVYVMASQNQ